MNLVAVVAVTLLSLVNTVRIQHHVQPVRPVAKIGHCTERKPLACVRHFGYSPHEVGVVTVWGPEMTVPGAVESWLLSPPHRRILLGRQFHWAGVFIDWKEARVVFLTNRGTG